MNTSKPVESPHSPTSITNRLSRLPERRQESAIWSTFGAAEARMEFHPRATLRTFFELLDEAVTRQEQLVAAETKHLGPLVLEHGTATVPAASAAA